MLSGLHKVRDRVLQIIVQRTHVVALANAENVVREIRWLACVRCHELIEHLEEEDVQSLELMPDETFVSESCANLIEWCEVVSRRIGVILHIGERGLNQRDVDIVLSVRVAR